MNRVFVYGTAGLLSGYLVKKPKVEGIAQVYSWIESQVKKGNKGERNS
jgi:hypothetical protein